MVCVKLILFYLVNLNFIISYSSIVEKGEEHCGELIEAHKKCMRDLGFKI